ncbi:hypothetical protein J6590_003522 [Homalodisca vitripennis]|nr:hypothetical protein J6590_003522 [Homalodisca vitripennis]
MEIQQALAACTQTAASREAKIAADAARGPSCSGSAQYSLIFTRRRVRSRKQLSGMMDLSFKCLFNTTDQVRYR